MIWLIWLVYFCGFVFVARKVHTAIRNDEILGVDLDSPSGDPGIVMRPFLAIACGVFWPLALLGLVLINPGKTTQEIKNENAEMRNRIAELEQELGIE